MSSTLLLIDVQRNMLEPPNPVPNAAAVSAVLGELLARARAAGVPVLHVRNNGTDEDPDKPGTPGWELVNEVRDGEPVLDKTTCDTFASTDLADLLPESAPLVIAGMQSEFCVRETALAALGRGHPVTLVRGGHATYDGRVPAAEQSREIEDELTAAGASLRDPARITF